MLKNVCVLSLLFAAGLVHAQSTETTTFNVLLEITETCDIEASAPTDVDFGTEMRTTNVQTLNAVGSLSVNCSTGTPYWIGLNDGQNFSASRQMTDGSSNFVAYELYQDSGHSTVWGNTELAGVGGTGNASAQAISIYGQVNSDLDVPAGNYADVITATINY